ncbi:MAG: UDP-N-acetylmuramate dehydrogenase [Clostridia bacterium]
MDNCKIKKIQSKLSTFIKPEDIYANEPMKNHTSFKIGGNADIFVKIRNLEQIEKTIELAKQENEEITIIGNGSNILVKDNGIRGIVAKICTESYEFIDEETIKVDAGMLNAKISKIALDNELSGFEFAAGIPGTIGGAIKMNAGAYGSEMKNIVVSTTYLDLEDNKIKTINNEEHKFAHRRSIFFNIRAIILNTTLKFTKATKEEIQNKINENNQSRKLTQPIDKPSAGSTFKRGTDFITSALIDQCGLKGFTVGGAQISEKHAGFVVNTGNSTAQDVIQLTEIVKQKVYEKFNKQIELEIEIIGE